MGKTWIIAEQITGRDFRILKVVKSEQEPTDEYRKAVTDVVKSYMETKIPATVNFLFEALTEELSAIPADASADDLLFISESLKHFGRTSGINVISTQIAAWCYMNNTDVLEYSIRNCEGKQYKRRELRSSKDFQAFLQSKCENKTE